MKVKNVKVGMKVLVKDKVDSNFLSRSLGKVGVVDEIVRENRIWIKFEDGSLDYGSPKDLKRVKEDSV